MGSILVIILPIFALIFAGWLSRKVGVLGSHATAELNHFVVYLALPSLLFDIVANAQWRDIWHPMFVATFGASTAIVFVITLTMQLNRSRHLADAAIDGLNSSYANTAFIGFPLTFAVFGQTALALTLIATILTVCILLAVALILVEIGLETERHPRKMTVKIAKNLIYNPILIAPLLGATLLALEVKVPVPLETFVKTLGSAASPCALVTVGLFLAEKQPQAIDTKWSTCLIVAFKLVLHPTVTWIIASQILHLETNLTHIATLLAALPTGTGPFVIAKLYQREANLTSEVILTSTVTSLITITTYLFYITP